MPEGGRDPAETGPPDPADSAASAPADSAARPPQPRATVRRALCGRDRNRSAAPPPPPAPAASRPRREVERVSGLRYGDHEANVLDLYRHRDDHEPSQKEALIESAIWVSFGLAFGGVIALAFGGEATTEYLSGYVIEKSLSVDNVFVWAMLFATFKIPLKYQHRVLFWGIFGALTLRALFFVLGTALISRFFWLLIVFGVFLIYTGAKIIRHRDDEGHDESTQGLGLLRRFMPVTEELDGQKFFTTINGKRAATPLLAAFV